MVTLRKLALGAFLTVSALATVTMTSCKKDDEGCATGYEGSDCKTLVSQKFIGAWTASDKETASGTAIATYVAPISPNSDLIKVSIGNFSNFFDNNVIATMSGTTLSIAEQDPDGDGYTVSGTATLASGRLSWNYTLKSPLGGTKTYDGTWTK